ncbi:MAG: ABC transporter permease [Phycisphaerales bacterium]
MLSYITRRVLLMIPTLIGITLLVFLIIAASPGGIGAGLKVSGGQQMQSSSSVAVQRAKLEDRYGLNEPVILQYFRWLKRVSPIKFGARDQVSPSGDLVTRPRPIPEPSVWGWVTDALEAPEPGIRRRTREEFAAMERPARMEAFRQVQREYVEARAKFTTDEAVLGDALKRYVEAIGRLDLIDSDFKPRVKRISRLKPDKTLKEYAEVERFARAAVASRKAAQEARERIIGAMDARPYEEVGFGISGVVHLSWPDLGIAFSNNQPVIRLISKHLPTTILLNLIAFPIIYMIAIPSGMLAAARKGSVWDVGLGSLYIGLYSVPVVLAGVLALGFLATPDYLNAFPTAGLHDKSAAEWTFLPSKDSRGWLLDLLWHIVLPVGCAVYGGFAILSKQTRAAMLENFSADYVRTAKAKGVSGKDIIFVHVLRNSLLPLITMFVTIFPAMLAGSVVIERIFSVQGMGWLMIEAINYRDREMILANTTIVACVNLVALLLADILYACADPRITYK